MDPIQRPVIVPKVEIFEQRAAWRQVLGDRAPLAAGAQDVHQAVHDFTDIDAPPAPASLGRRYQRRDMSPFAVRHVTRVAKLAAIIGAAIFRCPHRSCPPVRENTLESHPTHMIQQLFGRTLSNLSDFLGPPHPPHNNNCSSLGISMVDPERSFRAPAEVAISAPPTAPSRRSNRVSAITDGASIGGA